MHLLLVEDNFELGDAINHYFQSSGHAVDWGKSVAEALSFLAVGEEFYDLVILDLNLPDGSGKEILQHLRQGDKTTPVVVLTARSQVADKVHYLDQGADDYVSKPFEFAELDARCRAVIRRHQGRAENLLYFGRLGFDEKGHLAWFEDQQIELRSRETQLLAILINHRHSVLSKSQIIDRLVSLDDDVSENAIEAYVGRLRRKIAVAGVTVQSVRGLGYQLKLL
ncbi:MAG: response regulator transcription factor [Arenicellales bacterium]|jgi:two-component system response regulator TctD|nr:DNA-binding response regulator [Acidiferrobacteraceae bacterium]MDP6122467.1 response regulator transcription factor [Arenicellales bacterium]|tara:strand:- start:2358 stop:3029 length:672 start_codon:yes stop_codon:yes gene_type:complete